MCYIKNCHIFLREIKRRWKRVETLFAFILLSMWWCMWVWVHCACQYFSLRFVSWCDAAAFLFGASYLHVCSSMIRVHVSHFTWQHQWNLQLQRSFTIIFFVLYPRPQHKIAQPSKPDDDLLQTRLCVPVNKWENEYTHAKFHSTTSLRYMYSIVCLPGHCNCFVFRHQSGLSSK